jgi:hypothetical protein
MTERDNDRENFLTRWSRRKIDAERPTPERISSDAAARDATPDEGDKPPACAADVPGEPARTGQAAAHADGKPAFDITRLPSLDSITAATDIRAFLAPGVPAELTRAALRRAWAADPAIRDFKGLAENDWDFTDPKAMAGFSELPADYDIKKIITQIFGEKDETAAPATAAEPERIATSTQPSAQPREIPTAEAAQPAATGRPAVEHFTEAEPARVQTADIVHRNIDIAAHNHSPTDEAGGTKGRRTHGSALPQ